MRRIVACIAYVALAVLPAAGAPPLTPAQIDRVLARAHVAAGGAVLDRMAGSFEAGGASVQGGAPQPFTNVTDLRTGYFRQQVTIGPSIERFGYDGAQWTERNGIFSIVSLPAFVADGVSAAYLSSNAFFRRSERATVLSGYETTVGGRKQEVLHVKPPGGSAADLFFDAVTYRLTRVVAYTASGIDTTTFSQYRTIQGIPTSMVSVDVDPSGTKTTTTLSKVTYTRTLDPKQIARPPYVSHGNLKAPISVAFRSDDEGAIGDIVIPVKLDAATAPMYFDSGGGNFLVPQAAKRLGLKLSGDTVSGGVGAKEQITHIAAVSTVDIGGAQLRAQNFVVTGLPYAAVAPRAGMTVDGLVGYEFLANYRVIVRYPRGRIEIAPFSAAPPAGGVTLPFKSDGAHSYVKATIDGASGYFLLDTGNAGGLDLNDPFVREHHLFTAGGLPYVSPGGVGGTIAETVAVAKSFRFAGITFHNMPLGIIHTKAGIFATRGIAGNIGARVLSRFTVVFDYRAGTVTFIPGPKPTARFRTDRTGLSLDQRGPDAFEVLAVVPHSPAAQAGMRAGDRIVAIDGKKVSSGIGFGNMRPYVINRRRIVFSIERNGTTANVTVKPRNILPPPQ